MRRARMSAVAGLPVAITLLTVVAGCADRENDLDTYYDDPPATQQQSDDGAPAGTSEAPQATPDNQRPSSTGSDEEPAGQGRGDGAEGGPRAALLTDRDVAEEGVTPIEPAQARPDPAEPGGPTCLTSIAEQPESVHVGEKAWRYPTGSTLHQLVTRYDGRSASDVLAGRVDCGGEQLPVSGAPEGVETQAWCQEGTCTVVIAADDVLSTVEVRAADRASASEAIHRLAPVAVGKQG